MRSSSSRNASSTIIFSRGTLRDRLTPNTAHHRWQFSTGSPLKMCHPLHIDAHRTYPLNDSLDERLFLPFGKTRLGHELDSNVVDRLLKHLSFPNVRQPDVE